MAQVTSVTSSIKTSDGVDLSYIRVGPASAPTLLFIPGWAQTAAQWRKQISYFSPSYNVLACDHRGQGDSDKPNHGYRISRLAADLNDLILALDLSDITLIGHSMGCSVLWSFWDLFAPSRQRIRKMILVDQSARMVAEPSWTPEFATSIAAVFSPTALFDVTSNLQGPNAETFTTAFVKSMFTTTMSDKDLQWTLEQNRKMRYQDAAALLVNHAIQDWRDILPRIEVPVLVIGAEKSLFPAEGINFVASQIPGAELKIFKEAECGSHFMFWENAELFNEVINEFLLKGTQ